MHVALSRYAAVETEHTTQDESVAGGAERNRQRFVPQALSLVEERKRERRNLEWKEGSRRRD